jgi:hypothetical protein
MPTSTYDLIASNVLGSSAASVTFSSIPATYRDLILVIDASSADPTAMQTRFNSDSGANYGYVRATVDGAGSITSAAAFGATSLVNPSFSPIYENATVHIIQVMDYSATDKHKTVLSRYNYGTGGVYNGVAMTADRWANTAAINTISVGVNSSNFASGSSFYLFGIVS